MIIVILTIIIIIIVINLMIIIMIITNMVNIMSRPTFRKMSSFFRVGTPTVQIRLRNAKSGRRPRNDAD